MKKRSMQAVALALLALAGFGSTCQAADVAISYLHRLSNFSGTLPFNAVRVHADRLHDEIYVADQNIVRVFNDAGMEIYWFGYDLALGAIRDLAVDEQGDILILGLDLSDWTKGPSFFVSRCDYRGEPSDKISVTNLPAEFSRFMPNLLFYREGRLLLVSTVQMLAVVADVDGAFRQGYDLGEMAGVAPKDRPNTEIFGFNLDSAGNMLFTVPVLFKAFVVSPEGKVDSFGKAGSAPGQFGIVSGIVADDNGNLLVSERLRSVVMVFDHDFRFIKEFGYRGDRPESLVMPTDLAIGNSGRLYVTQAKHRGVSVFAVSSN